MGQHTTFIAFDGDELFLATITHAFSVSRSL